MMEEEVQSETYIPDFSDIYDESFQFWDFMNHKETSKKRPFNNETCDDVENMRPYVIGDHSSLLKRDNDSHTFWDFLSSRTENTTHLPDSYQFSDIFSSSHDRVGKKLDPTHEYRETNDDRKVQQKCTSSDEFWDFLNSSVEDKNYAAEAPVIPCSSPVTEEQLNAISILDTDVPNHSILPRISSVFSLNTTSSVEKLPGIITPLTSIMNNSCELSEATHQLVAHNNASSDYKMVYYATHGTGGGSLSTLKHKTNATHQVIAQKNPMNDYELKYYITCNADGGNSLNSSSSILNSSSYSILKHNTETINHTVIHENAKNLTESLDALKFQEPISKRFQILRESKLPNAMSCTTSDSCETKQKSETISHTESLDVNHNYTEPVYVLLPKSEPLQKPNYSQYLIIVNNTQPQVSSNKGEVVKKIEPKITVQNVSSTKNHQPADDNSFQSDCRLAGLRNNHVLNVCKRKRSFELPFDTSNSESNCSVPISSVPMDKDTLNSILARSKIKQNTFPKMIKKQNTKQKPIKCIPLGRCKNAIQQTNMPISVEASESHDENTLLKPYNTPLLTKSKADGESMRDSPKNFSSPSNSFLMVTFSHIPNWDEKHHINYPAKQSVASSYQVTEIHDTLSGGVLPEPSSSSRNKVEPKMKKSRRKTVKELLQERQSEIASLTKQRKFSKYYVGEVSSEISNSVTESCDDPKNDVSAPNQEGEMSHPLPQEKSFRPRHYDMSELQIGFLKVQEDVNTVGRFRSKFKVLFMKRQFLYDFPVSKCNQPSLKTLHQEGDDEMVRIAVPFKTITSINLKDRIIYLNVNSTPEISVRSPQGNTTFWSHFLQSSYTHKVVLRKRQASKLKWILCQCDERFDTLTDIIITTSCGSQFDSPVSFKKRFSKNRIARRPQPENLILNRMCSCRTSCRSIRCSCVKAARSCSSTCQCINCNNPLNVLEARGLDIYSSLKDTCLFQNIYQIPDLSNYLEREVRLDCCNCLARIQDCIPGTVLCPNFNCNAFLQYSWCQKMVSYPERNPRNHCSLCGQCRFSNGRHCHVCKKCYVITSKSNKCPTCLTGNSTLQQLPRRSLNTFCYDKKLICTSSKPQIVVLNTSPPLTEPSEVVQKLL